MNDQDRKILKQFGERIKNLRKQLGFTQEELADKANIERSYMGTLERGERNPTLLKVYRIAKALKVSGEKLLPF